MSDQTHTPFKERTSLAEARERLRERIHAHGRTESVELGQASGRVVATAITAQRDVPHYRRAAMDGYAVSAEDTFGASDRSPVVLDSTDGDVEPRTARQVHTGSELPDGADAVVMTERVSEREDELEIFDTVGAGENVAPVGEDIEAGQRLYDPGTRLEPSDMGLLKSIGTTDVSVFERPSVQVIPTGDEVVEADPAPGEVVETNGLTVTNLVRSWGGDPTYCDVVPDDTDRLAEAIESGLSADVVVTTGGSSVGARDLLPEVVSDIGEVFVHGVGIKPGHPVALGRVEETPVLMLPGYPVSCLVNAVQFLRPTLAWLYGTTPEPFPAVTARLDEKIHSEPGIRSFARVRLDEDDGEYVASAVRASGAGVLSSVALSDGWVVVPENSEGIDKGESVTVERWETQL